MMIGLSRKRSKSLLFFLKNRRQNYKNNYNGILSTPTMYDGFNGTTFSLRVDAAINISASEFIAKGAGTTIVKVCSHGGPFVDLNYLHLVLLRFLRMKNNRLKTIVFEGVDQKILPTLFREIPLSKYTIGITFSDMRVQADILDKVKDIPITLINCDLEGVLPPDMKFQVITYRSRFTTSCNGNGVTVASVEEHYLLYFIHLWMSGYFTISYQVAYSMLEWVRKTLDETHNALDTGATNIRLTWTLRAMKEVCSRLPREWGADNCSYLLNDLLDRIDRIDRMNTPILG